MIAEAYVVVAGNAHFGPFASRDAAHDWTSHPDRTVEVRGSYRVVPLFGGLLLDPLDGEPATREIDVPTYPGQFGLTRWWDHVPSGHLCDEECGDPSHPRDGRITPAVAS